MRTWEIVVTCWLLAWALCWLMRGCARSGWLFALGSCCSFALQAALEGWRVHLLPLAALALVLAGLTARFSQSPRRALISLPLGGLLLLGVAMPSMFPVFRYDAPSGAYAVGSAQYDIKDPARARDLAIQVWYPAAPGARGERVGITTRPDLLKQAYASLTGLPAALFDHLRLIDTHATWNAALPAGAQRFPVVLFSHGPIAANRSQSIFQMEALASHGFVVVALDHTGAASLSLFADGRAVPADPRVKWPVFADDTSRALVASWVKDAQTVLDWLAVLNRKDERHLFEGRLALDRIGYVGASFGGSVVVQALLDEPRIKAGVAQDGKPYFFDRTLTELERPLLYLQSSLPYIPVSDDQLAKWGITQADFTSAKRDHYARLERLLASARAPLYDVVIDGTDHISFSDLHLLLRVANPQLRDVREAHRIINAYTSDFLDRYLNGAQGSLSDGHSASPFAGVTVRTRRLSANDAAQSSAQWTPQSRVGSTE